MLKDLVNLLPQIADIAKKSAHEIRRIYEGNEFEIKIKHDQSPITEADQIAHHIIVEDLEKLCPGVPLLSEEEEVPPFKLRQQWSEYWCIDPLDGTKEFIAGTYEFSVNIALIVDHQPILGVIVSPILQTCYTAIQGVGAFREDALGHRDRLQTGRWPQSQALKVAVSRRHSPLLLAERMSKMGEYSVLSLGSSLKFCAIAEQRADLYPRFGPTCEWDTAAGQCILEAAGGAVVDLQGLALRYNTKENIYNPGFIATGDLSSLLKHLALIKA